VAWSVLGLEPALRVQRGHASAAGRRDGLPVNRVLHVAGRKHSGTLVIVASPLEPPRVRM